MAEQELDLDAVREELREKAKELAGKAATFAREQPHVAVGLAFGVGWILGNGLSPRLVMGAARMGWKALLGGALAGLGEEAEPVLHGVTPRPGGARHATGEGGAPGSRSGAPPRE
jgi:hypothetical protein